MGDPTSEYRDSRDPGYACPFCGEALPPDPPHAEYDRLKIAIRVLAERQVEIIVERDALRADKVALIDSRQAVIDERNIIRANLHRAVNELRTSMWGYAQYLHNIDHSAPITECHQGICPGVRGLLRRTEDAEDSLDTAVYVSD